MFDSLGLFGLVAGVVAFFYARSISRQAKERLDKAERQIETLRTITSKINKTLLEQAGKLATAVAPVAAVAPADAAASAPIEAAASARVVEALPIAEAAPAAVVAPIGSEALPAAPSAVASDSSAAAPAAPNPDPSAAAKPAPSRPALPAIAAASGEAPSLEEKIALVWFTRIGAMALLVGVAFFFKYAVDNDWIGPLGRVALGALVGAGLLVAAEVVREQTKAIFVQVLLGVGLSFLFMTAYASHAFYALVPAPAAFVGIAIVALLGGALSIHHKGEPILILSLIAGFLCPILLSTGEDRPGALFAYLFVLTTLAFAASVRMGFRYATWLGIAGVVALFAGWHGKFFEVRPPHPRTAEDFDDSVQAGAYYLLADRVIPLVAVTAFLAQWLALARAVKRAGHAAMQPLALLVAALLLAHAGFTSLLFDHAAILGAVLAALALLSSLLLGMEDRRELLGLPLLAAFLVLLATAHDAREEPTGLLGVLGILGVVYAGGFLRGQFTGGKKPDQRMVIMLCGVGVAVSVVASVLLIELHATVFALVLAVLSLAYAALAIAVEVPVVAAGAVVLSLLGLLAAQKENSGLDAKFLVAAGAWAAIYFGSGAYELLVRKAAPTMARLFTTSAAVLGFALLVMYASASGDWLLRSLTMAVIGALDLGVGVSLLRGGQRKAATVLLGQALGLFAAAAALLFSGATITIVWAILACVVAVLAAVDEDPYWLAGAGTLFVITLVRAFAIDFEIPDQQQREFLTSRGVSGVLRAPFLLNPRAYALAGTAAALLVAARSISKRSAELFKQMAFGFFLCGHAVVTTLLVVEAKNLWLVTPAPPPVVPYPLESGFDNEFFTAVAAQADALSVLTTVVMALYAAILIGIGFGAREKNHRFLGLGLFSLTLLKLLTWDVWHLARIYQMVVLVAMGALLLGSSFLYARFGKRLVRLIRDGELTPGATKIALFFLAATSLAAGSARALEPKEFAQSRAINGVSAPGMYRLEIDPPLYRATARQLGDVRIADPGGNEVPFVARQIPAPVALVRHDATVVDPLFLPDGSTRVVLDLGQPGLKHSQVHLDIGGSNFLRRTEVEISHDERHYDVLASGALVYRVYSDGASGANTTIRYPVSDARYLRITIFAGADAGRLSIEGAHLAYTTAASSPPVRTLEGILSPMPKKPDVKSSFLLVDLGAPGVPFDSLQLDIATPLFERRAFLKTSEDLQTWQPLGGGLVYRAKGAQSSTLEFSPTRARYLRVELVDEDNPPLAVTAARASYLAEELVFSTQAAGAHTLYVGSRETNSPAYDLAAILARSGEVTLSPAAFGPLGPNPEWRAPPPPVAPIPPASERHKVPIIIALVLLLAGLGFWTMRLLQSSKDASGPPAA